MSCPPSELLAAVHAAPTDDAPRLVLADWLQERGQAWGELIAVQCALAHENGPTPARAKLLRREPALLETHAEWCLGVANNISENALTEASGGYLLDSSALPPTLDLTVSTNEVGAHLAALRERFAVVRTRSPIVVLMLSTARAQNPRKYGTKREVEIADARHLS